MTRLEQDVLQWIADHSGDSGLRAQIERASEKKRDFVGTGVFLYLQVPPDCPPLPQGVVTSTPTIVSPSLMDGAGASLFLKDGRLHYLELYSRSGFLPEELDDYDLVAE